ncbi:membrane protease FtsH catalytic subunit [Desulfuromusa kysingii]|uniref:ATP-dependent zinc metalloprotease FtsH n=1 Tax=Desulfuromusa kysingii TaxID=37625 RepID=A0A1H3WYA7_9BACT|nr:ATP-dependent zinc metalloprotease FtsH [Desulfuromusa kysingii]SDZ91930.1 membrane protease FtsH catalytic subunit [Desulfuromusa kysingii]
MSQFQKNLALWLVISLLMIMLFNMMTQKDTEQKKLNYTEFLSAVDSGQVASITFQGNQVSGVLADGGKFQTYAPMDDQLIPELKAKGVVLEAKPVDDQGFWFTLLISWGPILLLIAVWIFFMRQMQGGGGKAMSFGKSKAKLLTDTQGLVTFKDVAGVDEAKQELEEVVEFLKDPKKFTKLGGKIPKGVLLVGSPGTGKTLLARSVAGEAGVPFFTISGSDFVEMFVGVGASRVRDLFLQGKKNAPCIIFIDEIDAVGRHRGAGLGGGHDEREQTLNQLLVEMDGFESNEGVILVAATNRPDVLDPALLRPGRFDRQVMVPRPDIKGRHKILMVHSRKVPMSEDVNLEVIAKATPGFSGADLANLINEAALLAARSNKATVEKDDFEAAKDKVLMGAERRSMVITEEEKKVTAYHEAGHALVSLLTPGSDPVHKVSIIPRGRAMGVTMYLPTEEKYSETAKGLNIRIRSLLGGRIAEEITFESVTSGASNDLERVTTIARKMVCEWGMSEKIGPMAFGEKEGGEVFLGRDMGHVKNYSEATAVDIDNEIRRIVNDNYQATRKLLKENQKQLIALSELLLEKETLDSAEILDVVFPDGWPDYLAPKVAESAPEEPPKENDSSSAHSAADSNSVNGEATKVNDEVAPVVEPKEGENPES